jgi:hypothetical protein
MRLAFVSLMAAALPALAGCNSPAPSIPDTAWIVNLTEGTSSSCSIVQAMPSVGMVTADTINRASVVTDGADGASVTCTVSGSGSGPYAVSATMTQGANALSIDIPAISTTATQTASAPGSVSVEATEDYTSNDCNFYFVPQTPETVLAGRIWVAFTCAAITNGPSQSTCEVLPSYAVFEDCETVATN